MEKPQENGTIQLCLVWNDGKRHQRTLKYFLLPVPRKGNKDLITSIKEQNKVSKAKAEQELLELELKISKGQTYSGADQTLIEYYNKVYQRRRVELRMASNTTMIWQHALKHLQCFLDEQGKSNIQLKDVTPTLIEDYKQYLLTHKSFKNESVQRPISASSANLYLAKLTCVVNKAIVEGLISNNLMAVKKSVRVEKKEVECLTKEEVDLLTNSSFRVPAIRLGFLISCSTGFRIGDIRNLCWQDVDFENKVIKITTQKTKANAEIPIGKRLMSLLTECKDQFPTSYYVCGNLKRYRNESNYLLREWFDKVGITRVHPHNHLGRATFGSLLLSSDVNLFVISKLLTHANLNTTAKYYLKEQMAQKKSAIDTLD